MSKRKRGQQTRVGRRWSKRKKAAVAAAGAVAGVGGTLLAQRYGGRVIKSVKGLKNLPEKMKFRAWQRQQRKLNKTSAQRDAVAKSEADMRRYGSTLGQ